MIYNRGKKKTLPEQKNEGVPDFRAAENAWNMEKQVDKSFIRETFYGQWRSVLSKHIEQHKFSLNIDLIINLIYAYSHNNSTTFI